MSDPNPTSPLLNGVVVDSARPLSQSLLWQIQQGYFNELGIQAWTSGQVPFHLTTGALLARTYSRLVAAFLEDCTAGLVEHFDPCEPMYVIALGAGTGRFGYEFLRAFDAERFAPLRVVYVFTDLAEKNIKFINEHQQLQPVFNEGRADCACYEMGSDQPFKLIRSGVDLCASPPVNPIICFANYALDVLPQDLYVTIDSVLHQELVELSALTTAQELNSADFLASLFVATERASVTPTAFGSDLPGRALSSFVKASSNCDRRFLFPVAALRTIETLLRISRERLLLLVTDRCDSLPLGTTDRDAMDTLISTTSTFPKGYVTAAHIDGREKYRPAILGMGIHGGCFSLPVDMNIISDALEPLGFSTLTAEDPPKMIQISVLANETLSPLLHLRRAHAEVTGDLSTENILFTLTAANKGMNNELGLREMLAILRVSGYDPGFLREYRFALEAPLRAATPALVEEAEKVFDKVFDHFFPLLETEDLAWDIAILLAVGGRYESALVYHERSLMVSGPSPERCWRIAECYFLLGDQRQARLWVDQSLDLQPDYAPARILKARMLDEFDQAI